MKHEWGFDGWSHEKHERVVVNVIVIADDEKKSVARLLEN